MGTVQRERVEQRVCPGCGLETDFRVVSMRRGEDVALHMRKLHNAPCGRPCYESSGVSMREVIAGKAHHPRRCECLKLGRGYK